MKKVLVITGSTASGKSDLGVEFAKKFNGEIISCDSVQVYRGLDIGSAKITESEKQGVVHHMIDILDLSESMNVAFFQTMARKLIDDITIRGKLPICVGGTGFYIKALLYDYEFEVESDIVDDDFDELSNQELYELLQNSDQKEANKIHVNNRKRLLRVLRLMKSSGKTRTSIVESQKHELLYDAKVYFLTYPREELADRINRRVDIMMEQGLLDEVTSVSSHGQHFDYQALSAIGYREFHDYFLGNKTLEEVLEDIKKHSRQFSKRQMTWFRNQMPGSIVNMKDTTQETMAHSIAEWLNSDKMEV